MAETIKAFSSDIDNTLIGKPEATNNFNLTWNSLRPESKPVLIYNTGRVLESAKLIVKQTGLPEPDFFICGVGTQIYNVKTGEMLPNYHNHLKQNWDKELVARAISKMPQIEPQPEKVQGPFKSSWFLHHGSLEDLSRLKEFIQAEGIDAHIIYSSARDLDIVPKNANKGNALKWLLEYLNITPQEALVAGDSGNDSAMFQIDGIRGILVENSEPELLQLMGPNMYLSKHVCAQGVLEGLIHFKVIDNITVDKIRNITNDQYSPEILRLFTKEKTKLSDEEHKFLNLAYKKALEVIHRNISEKGFSACDINSNSATGTDENYFSVWSRDGCITVIGTLGCDDPAIQRCQKSTLQTLLKTLSPIGQVPSYVDIKTGKAEYSGLGGISSVDSNLWFVIAFYEYVKHYNDMDFLNSSVGKIKTAMNWLLGLDSNNDDLLEIPETGDWADLFGFSYHVLYDEVLWFRANMCYGWILEMQHSYEKAGKYFEKASIIKEAILKKFWPSSRQAPESFADTQSYLGDVKYLLPEVSPFKYNWRCDVYGNILAALFNILDVGRAKTVFRFLWGVGANEPYPVRNLYPTVHSGAHDWKDYFVINFQNLPDHYHNGGIWPFIGGYWVQFVNHLGLYDVACQELLKLGKLNQAGTFEEWEFNEWAHGRTGRPMGKAFQSWSAANFILAYNELGLSNLID